MEARVKGQVEVLTLADQVAEALDVLIEWGRKVRDMSGYPPATQEEIEAWTDLLAKGDGLMDRATLVLDRYYRSEGKRP